MKKITVKKNTLDHSVIFFAVKTFLFGTSAFFKAHTERETHCSFAENGTERSLLFLSLVWQTHNRNNENGDENKNDAPQSNPGAVPWFAMNTAFMPTIFGTLVSIPLGCQLLRGVFVSGLSYVGGTAKINVSV